MQVGHLIFEAIEHFLDVHAISVKAELVPDDINFTVHS
jgi:hypothetical protein